MSQEQHPGFWAVLPASVRYADISANAKILFAEIAALSNKNGYCHATNSFFAEHLNIAKRSVREWLSQLEEIGVIEVDYNPQREKEQRRIYTRIDPFDTDPSDRTSHEDDGGGRHTDDAGGSHEDDGGPLRSMNKTSDTNKTRVSDPNGSVADATEDDWDWQSLDEDNTQGDQLPAKTEVEVTTNEKKSDPEDMRDTKDSDLTPQQLSEKIGWLRNTESSGDLRFRLAMFFRDLFTPWMDYDDLTGSSLVGFVNKSANRLKGERAPDGTVMDTRRSKIEWAKAVSHLYLKNDHLHNRTGEARKTQKEAAIEVVQERITRKVKDGGENTKDEAELSEIEKAVRSA